MTKGHKHHQIAMKRGKVLDFLQKPRIWSTDLNTVIKSPYPYGVVIDGEIVDPAPDEIHPNEVYYLSILAILHRWTGLTIKVKK